MKHVAILWALALCSCSNVLEPENHVTFLQTDSTFYTARYVTGEGAWRTYGFKVITRFHNATRDTLFLARCYPESRIPIFGIGLIDRSDPWGSAYDPAWACVGHDDPIAVAPNRIRLDTLIIRGPNAVGGSTPLGVFEGTFRVAYRVQTCRKEIGCEIPGAGISNPFRVALE